MNAIHPSAPGLGRLTAVAVALSVTLVAFSACGDTVGPGQELDDELLFLSTRTADDPARNWANALTDIFHTKASGGEALNLTGAPAQHRSLSLSATGSTVSFVRVTDCHAAWVVNRDGSDARQVAGWDPFRCIHRPRISPDGSRIAMTSSRILDGMPGGWRVWVTDGSGDNAVEVSSSTGNSSWVWGWSPDGRILFHSLDVGEGTGVALTTYIVNPDGSNLQPFFARTGDHSPAWSPDGSQIAFLSDREGSFDVHVMNADGTNIRRITDLAGEARFESPADINENAVSPWSPDGTRIAFRNLADAQMRLYSVRVDGSDLTPLTEPSVNVQYFHGWSPSGRWIAFTSAGFNLHIAEADGAHVRNLTTGGWQDGHAIWLPAR